jgi:hypothetical protein
MAEIFERSFSGLLKYYAVCTDEGVWDKCRSRCARDVREVTSRPQGCDATTSVAGTGRGVNNLPASTIQTGTVSESQRVLSERSVCLRLVALCDRRAASVAQRCLHEPRRSGIACSVRPEVKCRPMAESLTPKLAKQKL